MGHTLESMTHMLGITTQVNTVTARYITVREQRKLEVLNAYHQALLAPTQEATKSIAESPSATRAETQTSE